MPRGKIKKVVDIVWVEDVKAYLPSIEDELKEIQKDFKVNLSITPKNSSLELNILASKIPSDLVFCIDYNLSNEGKGVDGDQIIKNIRKVNKDCWIFFYSFYLSQEELRALILEDSKTICQHRPDLLGNIRGMFEDGYL
ncbi:MAG: hypothetical protein RIC35_17230 [Marinoscillum sp.]